MGRCDARMSMTLPEELKNEFVSLAERNQRSLTQELILAIQEHIEREKKDAYYLPDGQEVLGREETVELIRKVLREELKKESD